MYIPLPWLVRMQVKNPRRVNYIPLGKCNGMEQRKIGHPGTSGTGTKKIGHKRLLAGTWYHS
jgi:hypothetical protein